MTEANIIISVNDLDKIKDKITESIENIVEKEIRSAHRKHEARLCGIYCGVVICVTLQMCVIAIIQIVNIIINKI